VELTSFGGWSIIFPLKIVEYIKETRSEMKHVSWPTRRQAMAFTAIVIVISVFVAVLLGLFDYLFTLGIERFILK